MAAQWWQDIQHRHRQGDHRAAGANTEIQMHLGTGEAAARFLEGTWQHKGDHRGGPVWRHTERHLHRYLYLSPSGRWVVGQDVGSVKGVVVSQAHSPDLGQLGQQSRWQIYDGKEWAVQVVSMCGGPWGGLGQQLRSTLPPIRVQDGRPVRGPMQQAAGRARTAGTAVVAEGCTGQSAEVGRDPGLWAKVVAAELTMLEGGGMTEAGVCDGPRVSTHLRVAQASGTSELGARNSEGVGSATGGPSQQRSRDPKRWPVRHHKGQGSGNAQLKKRSRTVLETGDQNAELCTGCGKGGHLYCCDGCPRVWHAACLQERGRVPPRSEGQWYGPCCSEEQTGVRVLPASGQSRGTASGEGSEGLRSQGSQERGSEPGEVRIGTPGQQVRYVYTGRRSERSPYIAERAQSMHGLTRGEMLQMYYKDRRGVCVPYQEKDLQYDITQGYLRKQGAGRVIKEGVLHRGPVGASKRGRAGGGGGGQKKSRRQAAALSQEQGEAVRPTQAQKRSRESPARMEKRARQRERPATPIQAPSFVLFCFVCLATLGVPVVA